MHAEGWEALARLGFSVCPSAFAMAACSSHLLELGTHELGTYLLLQGIECGGRLLHRGHRRETTDTLALFELTATNTGPGCASPTEAAVIIKARELGGERLSAGAAWSHPRS